MTLTFHPIRDIDLRSLRSNIDIAVSQPQFVRLAWNERDLDLVFSRWNFEITVFQEWWGPDLYETFGEKEG